MKAYIQNHATSGLGDFYSDVYTYINLSNFLQKLGYTTHLLFCPGVKYENCENLFQQIFNPKTYLHFNYIEDLHQPIHTKIYKDTVFVDEWCLWYQQGEGNWSGNYTLESYHQKTSSSVTPGLHHWDLYTDNLSFIQHIPRNQLLFTGFKNCSQKIYSHTKPVPGIIPEFSDYIKQKIVSYEEQFNGPHNFLHLRFRREDNELCNDSVLLEKIDNFIKKQTEPLRLGSNSAYITDVFKNHKNVFVYSSKQTKSAHKIYKSDFDLQNHWDIFNVIEPKEVLFEGIAEMATVKYVKNIYACNEYNWVSNYLFYGMLYNRNIKYINVNDLILTK